MCGDHSDDDLPIEGMIVTVGAAFAQIALLTQTIGGTILAACMPPKWLRLAIGPVDEGSLSKSLGDADAFTSDAVFGHPNPTCAAQITSRSHHAPCPAPFPIRLCEPETP